MSLARLLVTSLVCFSSAAHSKQSHPPVPACCVPPGVTEDTGVASSATHALISWLGWWAHNHYQLCLAYVLHSSYVCPTEYEHSLQSASQPPFTPSPVLHDPAVCSALPYIVIPVACHLVTHSAALPVGHKKSTAAQACPTTAVVSMAQISMAPISPGIQQCECVPLCSEFSVTHKLGVILVLTCFYCVCGMCRG